MDFVAAIGFQHFWGFSPALSLPVSPPSSTVLLAGTGDIRHMMYTLSSHCMDADPQPITVCLYEPKAEALARNMLLTLILTDAEVTIRERAELFLEVYGNALVRDRTAEYISQKASILIDLVTNHHPVPWLADLFDLTALKMKERDMLCDVFETWKLTVPFDTPHLRDQRMRFLYKERYDHRMNLADWDYHMRVKKTVEQIAYREYKDWRMTGVAYEFRLATYPAPNRTLSSYIPGTSVTHMQKQTRDAVEVRGFWADIVMSPYWGFGVEVDCCDACKEIMDRVVNSNRVNVWLTQHATDIAHYNVRRVIQRLETLQDFHFPPEEDRYAQYRRRKEGQEIAPLAEEVVTRDPGLMPGLQRLKVVLAMGQLTTLVSKQRFRGGFDVGVFGTAATYTLGTAVAPLFKPGAQVYVETLK